jgi:hypothetical protein
MSDHVKMVHGAVYHSGFPDFLIDDSEGVKKY